MKHFRLWIYLRFLEKEHFAMSIVHSTSSRCFQQQEKREIIEIIVVMQKAF
jgi:hypothetical protein